MPRIDEDIKQQDQKQQTKQRTRSEARQRQRTQEEPQQAEPTARLDLKTVPVCQVPESSEPLRPERFETPDGKPGWVVRLPENRPLATPAFGQGKLFLGGGYGSYSFYSLDLLTGKVDWQIRTKDDGPTAAVVEDGFVAFNTESCTVIVCEVKTGRVVWQEWLGDPLMAQPAVKDGKLYIAYPNRQHQHQLLCADLATGRHLWEQPITGDVISAPVVTDEGVYFACLDGTSFCLDLKDGAVRWQRQDGATVAPLVVNGRVITLEKLAGRSGIYQGVRRKASGTGSYVDREAIHHAYSPYLSEVHGGGSSVKSEYAAELDATVGFSSAPSSAKLRFATAHIGVSRVSGAWSYQGSRPAYARKKILGCARNRVFCLRDDEAGTREWELECSGGAIHVDDQLWLPPSLGKQDAYLTSTVGHVLRLDIETGKQKWIYDTQTAVPFQPCLAGGRLAFGTLDGRVVCIDTGDQDADGWSVWGGDGGHNLVR
jgi:outer membrane protein assembly factor BamB